MPQIPIIMPQLGESIAEAAITSLHVQPGDLVKADQDLIEVETNKATMNVASPCAGRVENLTALVGESYPVGTVLGYLEVTREEAHRIGERTRLALQAAKARGRLLGAANPAGGAAAGAAANRAGADARAAGVLPVIAQIRAAGARSLAEIADGLNARGIATARGGKWHATTVKNLVERAA